MIVGLTMLLGLGIELMVDLGLIIGGSLVTLTFILGAWNTYKGNEAFSVRRIIQNKRPSMIIILAFILAISIKSQAVIELATLTAVASIGLGLVYSFIYELVRLKMYQLAPVHKVWASAIKF